MPPNGTNGVNGTPKAAGPPKPLRLFVLSHPRTASNLFVKLFSEHPQLKNNDSTFLYAYFNGPDAQAALGNNTSEELKAAAEAVKKKFSYATYQYVLDKLENDVLTGETEGKIPFFKEHSCYLVQAKIVNDNLERRRPLPPKPRMEDRLLDLPENKRDQHRGIPYYDLNAHAYNPSVLPDRLWKSFAPVFIIRHPAKQVGSYYKASRIRQMSIESPEFEISTSYRFSRMLFDYFKSLYESESHGTGEKTKQTWPIVIDGDDLINDTEGMAERFCSLTGLDPSGVIYKWEKTTTTNPFEAVFKGTLNASSGVVKNKNPETPDLAKEALKWEKEWGGEVTHKLVQYAEKIMDDYKYLYSFRLRV